MSVLDSIIEWAQNDLYEWQSDAVRRLLTQDKLTDIDEKEILGLLKAKHGLLEQEELGIEARPLKKGDVSGAPKAVARITLKAMTNLLNVNALPDNSGLPFGHRGLTIIYGENAAGKSAYARVLKRACGARDKKEYILPNVFVNKPISPAKACFKISVNDDPDKIVDWEDGVKGSDILTNISVFDAKCARIIIDENNEATYLPYGAYVFADLVPFIKKIRGYLQKEKPEIKRLEYPDTPLNTKAGKFLIGLTNKITEEEIKRMTLWNEDDKKKLLGLQKQIIDAQANDLQKQAKRLRNLRDRINQLANILEATSDAVSPEKNKALKELIKKMNVAEKALAVVSKESLASEPLSGVGESVWRSLYEAAKRYSVEIVYPGKDFPEIGEGSRCVFCMQLLSEEAKGRLRKFKKFMEETTKKDMEDAAEAIERLLKNIRKIDESLLETYKDVLDEISLRNDKIIKDLRAFYSAMIAQARCMVQAATDKKEIFTLPPDIPNPIKCVKGISDSLEKEAKKVEEAADPKKIHKLESEKEELEARKCLCARQKQVLEYVESLKIANKFDRCIEETDSRGITLKGKKIISKSLTPELKRALQEELKGLNASHLPLNLKPYGAEGETSHKIELKGIQFSQDVNLTEILSEGEQRVVAIAGFLAELNIGRHECPIVLDDPVSSLDHIYREKIAECLVKEASCRQVIIFTHDIAFLLELERKAVDLGGILFFPQTVSKAIDELGKPEEGLPWHVMAVNNRINFLDKKLASFKELHRSNAREYNEKAASLYSMLREAWEAAVEETLFDKTIVRHGSRVKTLRLESVEVTDEDYKEIFLGMDQCSTWMFGHDSAKSLDENRPKPDQIREDINELRVFVDRVKQRKKKKGEERKAFLKLKKPDVG